MDVEMDVEMDVTETLATFVVQHRGADVPERVRHEAARALVNWVGCAVGGSRHETVERALAALREFSGLRVATVLGRTDRLDIMLAALMNGITSRGTPPGAGIDGEEDAAEGPGGQVQRVSLGGGRPHPRSGG